MTTPWAKGTKPKNLHAKLGVGKPEMPEVKLAHATTILMDRIAGMTVKAIAEKHHCSVVHISESIKYAIAKGVVADYQATILRDLCPLALRLFEKRLRWELEQECPDTECATQVLKGAGILGKDRPQTPEIIREEETLEVYLASNPKLLQALLQIPELVEGEVIRGELGAGGNGGDDGDRPVGRDVAVGPVVAEEMT